MKKTNSGNTEQQGIFAEKVQILKGSRSGYIGKITCNKQNIKIFKWQKCRMGDFWGNCWKWNFWYLHQPKVLNSRN